LERCVWECLGDRCCDAVGTVSGHQDDAVGIEPTLGQRAQQHTPSHRGLGRGLAIVEQLPTAVGAYAIGRENDPSGRSTAVIAHADPQAVEKQVANRQADRPPMETGDLAIENGGQAADGSGRE